MIADLEAAPNGSVIVLHGGARGLVWVGMLGGGSSKHASKLARVAGAPATPSACQLLGIAAAAWQLRMRQGASVVCSSCA